MILYNVTVKIDSEIHEDWLNWMRAVHIPEVMATEMFTDYKICRILQEETDGVTYAIQYFCTDLQVFQQYQLQFVPRLQAEHTQRYHNKYVAFRTLMEVID